MTPTCVSAFDRFRWRTIGIMGGFYVVALLLKLVARMAPEWGWVGYGSVLTAFEPQALVSKPDEALALLGRQAGALLGLGLAGYIVGGVAFARRDLPAPL